MRSILQPKPSLQLACVCLLASSSFAQFNWAALADDQHAPVATPDGKGSIPSTASDTKPAEAPIPKLIYKPGQTLSVGMETEDIVVTDDVPFAREQAAHFADSPEAAFILACALTRTSMVEEALKQVRHARKLAEAKGGPAYFDTMIKSYEEMAQSYPDDNRIRYGLAWAYYMKAYVLAKYATPANMPTAPIVQAPQAAQTASPPAGIQPPAGAQAALPPSADQNKNAPINSPAVSPAVAAAPATNPAIGNLPWQQQWVGALAQATTGVKNIQGHSDTTLPHIPDVLSKAPAAVQPQLRYYYESALHNLDQVVEHNPNDVWSLVYRAFLRAEYTGDLEGSMKVWRDCESRFPDNPAPYFFLGEGYLKQGNLKESLQNISRAIALRGIGK